MAYIYAIYTNIRHAVENTRYGIRYAYRGSGVRMEWTRLGEREIGKLYTYIYIRVYIKNLQVLSYNMKLNPFKCNDLTTHERKE